MDEVSYPPLMASHLTPPRGGRRGCAQEKRRRLERLRQQIAAGTYVVDLGRLADGLMAHRRDRSS